MSVIIDYPMDFQKYQSSGCFSGFNNFNRCGRKRKLDSEFDQFIITPNKLSRREISPEDVKKCDITWAFNIEPGQRTNLEVGF